jgi:hypothetical protein
VGLAIETIGQNFCGFIAEAMQAGQTAQLSDHPQTQALLQQLREEYRNA